ncbi:MAG: hypothetical protein ACK5C3_02780, partial [bacterium]
MHQTPRPSNSTAPASRDLIRVAMSDSDGGNRPGGNSGGNQPGGPNQPQLPPNRGGRQVFGWVLAA